MESKKRIFVGLSGGVDSAVSAALLKEAGHDVTGVFIKIWSPEFLECTWREDRLDAMRVAVHLGIPFLEIDLSEQYRNSVVRDMIDNYKKGITPNPDVLCNLTIKFGAFLDWAIAQGADAIATGHYARNEAGNLLKGVDPSKDQSYFLYRLSKSELGRSYFPVGGYTKREIREKAKAFALPNALRRDSQGLCFVGDVSMRDFLSRFIELRKGVLISSDGAEVGHHDGAALYTIGQRHGFSLAPGVPEGPYYVTKIDVEANVIHVSRDRTETLHDVAHLESVHWIGETAQDFEAVTRYHGSPISVHVEGTRALFRESALLTPGQSLVFYDGMKCLGGANIASVEIAKS